MSNAPASASGVQPVVYRRILLKLSGEALQSAASRIDPDLIDALAGELGPVARRGVQIGLVIGGGNLWRGTGKGAEGIERATADQMGMLATVINALAIQQRLERNGLATRLQTAMEIRAVAEPFIRRRAMRHLEKGRIVLFAAGTGSPFFTTDTAAALRAREIGAQVIFKATKVAGVFDSDPVNNAAARRFRRISYGRCIARRLAVMDSTAITMCMESAIPIIVYDMDVKGNLYRAVLGEEIGTLICGDDDTEEFA